jgi:hypothetical protein
MKTALAGVESGKLNVEGQIGPQSPALASDLLPPTSHFPQSAAPCADLLEARYRASGAVRDLIAWSDAVGAESERICRQAAEIFARGTRGTGGTEEKA